MGVSIFEQACKELTGKSVPMYSTGHLSQLLLYGDMSKLGAVIPPTESEVAKLIWKARSGALKELKIPGVADSLNSVKDAFCFLRRALNSNLPKQAKELFHGKEMDP